MKSSDIAEMFEEYNKGGEFRDFVNRCVETYQTDVVNELHKSITLEVFKYMKNERKGKVT